DLAEPLAQVPALPGSWLETAAAGTLVLVDGSLDPRSASRLELPAGVRVSSLAEALDSDDARADTLVGSLARPKTDPFHALNTALFADGLLVELDPGVRLDEPLHMLCVASGREVLAVPRICIRLGQGSRATLVEHSLTLAEGASLSVPLTEVELGAGSRLGHLRLQDESQARGEIASLLARLEANATLSVGSLSLGAALSRYQIEIQLAGEGAAAELSGLYLGRGSRTIDHHVWIDHAAPRTRSLQQLRGILDERSQGVFRGRVHVRPGSQQIDASQSHRTLMLSDDARVHAEPQLEIYADDVKCSHGNAVGQLDPDALFYLRSRGLPESQAREVLTEAFAREALDSLPLPGEGDREALAHRVREWLQ
ncbi:MAG: Fe-S cluster assembly protein SufD, partial [Myxococcota bacterium]